MKRWEVLIDNLPCGYVEGMSTTDLIKAVEADPQFNYTAGDRRTLSFRRDELSMNILIDTTNWRAIARHDSHKALGALAVIQFANIDTQIVRLGENRVWSAFDAEQLKAIAASVGVEMPADANYTGHIRAVRAAMETVEWLALPFTTEALVGQAYGLAPEDDKPYGFNPDGSEPKPLKAWPCEPQKGRRRMDSSHWHMFRAGLGYGPGVTTPETLAHLGAAPAPSAGPRKPPPRPGAAADKPAKAPAAPKAPRAPSAPATRPKAGTATGKVWDLADQLWSDTAANDIKAFRTKLTAACEAEGINAGTVGVQFSKWKSSKGI